MKKGVKRKPAAKQPRAPRSRKKVRSTKTSKKSAAQTPPIKRRVVVTGGTGFIGHYICHELASKGFHVIILTQGESKQTGHDNETTVHWDGMDAQTLLPYIDGCYAIINLAGEPIFGRWTPQKKRKILESRVHIGKTLMQVIQQVDRKPAVFLQASAIGYYGSSADMLDEQSPAGSGFLSSVAIEWESSTDAAALLGIRHITVRLGVVLGRDGGAFPRMVGPFRYFLGGSAGSGNQYFSFVHVMDVVRAMEFLLENTELDGVFNLTAPHPCTNREFSTAISKILHRPLWFGASSFLLGLLYGKAASETVLANQRAIPKRLERAGFHFLFPTAEQCVADLLAPQKLVAETKEEKN